jgi:hypothetical protein
MSTNFLTINFSLSCIFPLKEKPLSLLDIWKTQSVNFINILHITGFFTCKVLCVFALTVCVSIGERKLACEMLVELSKGRLKEKMKEKGKRLLAPKGQNRRGHTKRQRMKIKVKPNFGQNRRRC